MALMKIRRGALAATVAGNALYPLLSQDALTLSAGVITDVTRLAGVEGDGLAIGSGAYVGPAATNLVTNGNATTNTTGWVAAGTATLAQVTGDGKFGTTCFKWTVGATPSGEGAYSDSTLTGATAGRPFTISRWLKGVGGSVGKTVRLVIREVGGASGTSTVAIAGFTLTADWQLCSLTGTVVQNDRTGIRNDIVVGSTGTPVTTADEIKFGGVSTFESTINMPYIHTDGGTAARAAGRVQMPASVLDETSMTLLMRLRMGHASTSLPAAFVGLFDWGDDSNNRMVFYYDGALKCFRRTAAGFGSIPSAALSYSNGDSITVGMRLNAAGQAISANGGAWSQGANTNIPVLTATSADIGDTPVSAGSAGLRCMAANALWVAAFRTADSGELTALAHAFGNNRPLPHMFPSSAKLSFLAHFNGDGTFYRRAA